MQFLECQTIALNRQKIFNKTSMHGKDTGVPHEGMDRDGAGVEVFCAEQEG